MIQNKICTMCVFFFYRCNSDALVKFHTYVLELLGFRSKLWETSYKFYVRLSKTFSSETTRATKVVQMSLERYRQNGFKREKINQIGHPLLSPGNSTCAQYPDWAPPYLLPYEVDVASPHSEKTIILVYVNRSMWKMYIYHLNTYELLL